MSMMHDFDAMTRFLAGSEKLTIDYTIFSMVLVTMACLFIVDAIRHKLDHIARGHDFFEQVLEACYHELSTLGIVEACVFILHEYYKGFILTTEAVFAQVHFTLFFVVIFNAVMSTLLYLSSCRVAHNQWTLLEAVDLDHYVSVRKQFEAVNKELDMLQTREINTGSKSNENLDRSESLEHRDSDIAIEPPLVHLKGHWYKTFWRNIVIKNLLKRKQRELLVQVRFHEMRVHFIESHKLPHNFRISDYLMLCLSDEFKNLINVSSISWYILMFVVNLVYYVMGIIYAQTENQSIIESTLSAGYLSYSVVFVVVSYVVFLKMKQIFFKIVKDETWIVEAIKRSQSFSVRGHIENQGGFDNRSNQSSLRRDVSTTYSTAESRFNQKSYFWGNDPSYVRTIGQLGQFGYALSLAIVLVFHDTISAENKGWQALYLYIIVPLLCYFSFMLCWSYIMPKYTQCTSLGELVRKSHLIEIDARSKLIKAKSKRQEDIDYFMTGKKRDADMKTRKSQRKRQDSYQSSLLKKFMEKMGTKKSQDNFDDDNMLDTVDNDSNLSGSQRLSKMTHLVKQDTKDLPDEKVLARRIKRQRARSLSDGVAAMRLFSSTSLVAEEALKSDLNSSATGQKLQAFPSRQLGNRRPRKKMMSTGVMLMQSEKSDPLSNDNDIINSKPHVKNFEKQGILSDTPFLHFKKTDPSPNILKELSFFVSPAQENREGGIQNRLDIVEEVSIHASTHSEESIEKRVTTIEQEIVISNMSIEERIRTFLLHQRYPLLSAIFGTTPAFFLLSVRLEIILLDTCALQDNLNTWNFIPNRSAAFWLTVAWFTSFLVESLLSFLLFGRKGTNFHPLRLIAAAFDLVLTCICVVLFLWAESQRCCICNDNNVLRASSKDDTCEISPLSECCPSFGSRLCGGVGNIEPYTSLIALRIFRFQVARVLVFSLKAVKNYVWKEPNNEQSIEKFIPSGSDYDNVSRDEIDFHLQTGTIAELWILALEKYPEIAKEHGIFSGLLLETMLGIEKLPYDPNASNNEVEKSDTKSLSNVKFRERRLEHTLSALSIRSAGGSSIGFDLNTHNNNNFLRPAAPLIRSMRRCECKWHWLKSQGVLSWDLVDVVMTEFEIVWFDATVSSLNWDDVDNNKRMQSVKDRISDKKGGKGLYLDDVAAGRDVMGRLAFSDIDHILIQRFMPSTDEVAQGSSTIIDIEARTEKKVFKEYWKDYDDSCTLTLPLDKQWEAITEDRLKLHSSQGTLYLRFFVDLYDVVEPVLSGEVIEKKQGALLWCESISHLCGNRQLKQKLPHFGEDRNHELQDFIEVIDRNREHDITNPQKRSLFSIFGGDEQR